MKITVDRTDTPGGHLIFTVTVSNPHHSCFGEQEKNIMRILDVCKEEVYKVSPEENRTKQHVVNLIHAAKERTFTGVLDNLKFAIENEFRPKFQPICQEIYNWIYDNQTEFLKRWMSEFDPQRTRYYFDNDITANKRLDPQESEHDDEDDE